MKAEENRFHQRVGFHTLWGATQFLSILILATLVTAYVENYFWPKPVDDCDVSVSQRCGMAVLTDTRTGLQYLATSQGGITPRLDANGKQLKKATQQ